MHDEYRISTVLKGPQIQLLVLMAPLQTPVLLESLPFKGMRILYRVPALRKRKKRQKL